MKKLMIVFLGFLLITPLTGCSIREAASIHKQTYEPDLLTLGRPRSHVLAQLGTPKESTQRQGRIVDVYEVNGNSRGWGYARAGAYGFLDVGTFGLWELVGTPLEKFIQQDQTITIYYDSNEQIDRVSYARD